MLKGILRILLLYHKKSSASSKFDTGFIISFVFLHFLYGVTPFCFLLSISRHVGDAVPYNISERSYTLL